MKILKFGLVLLLSVTLWGCGKGNSNAPAAVDPATNKHAAGWAVATTGGAHPDAYFAGADCKGCHGEDLLGGISKVSCSNPGRSGIACHATFPHGAGFANPNFHGANARLAATGIYGMAHCQKCHGTNYRGKDAAKDCIGCHKLTTPSTNAPHAGNWVSGTFRHSATDPTNAPACAQCHLGGALSHPAAAPAPAGTAPGCFNGTLCHNAGSHAIPYTAASDHGLAARGNIQACASCHATGTPLRFNVVKAGNANMTSGCETCHIGSQANFYGVGKGLAHPYMWLPGRGTASSHATATLGAGGAYCSPCHVFTGLTAGPSAPSCGTSSINGVSCHITASPVVSSTGCSSCHGAPPDGVTAPNRAFGHTAHFAIPGLACSVCHFGKGPGSAGGATHATGGAAEVAITTATNFNENGGTAGYNAGTGICSNVSCHGQNQFSAQPWTNTSPVLDLTLADPNAFNDSCYNCHKVSTTLAPAIGSAAPTPYIGPFSGQSPADTTARGFNLHQAHVVVLGALCMDCHNLSIHFNSATLGKRKLDPGFAVGSIGGAASSITSYTPGGGTPGTGSCLPKANSPLTGTGCHATKTWY